MTYILGARCKDGVVLVADRRFTVDEGSQYEYDNEILSNIPGIVIGFSGSRGVFEDFRNKVLNHVNWYKNIHDQNNVPIHELLSEISDITTS